MKPFKHFLLSTFVLMLFSCTMAPSPLRVHSKGPRIAQSTVPSFLKYDLNNQTDHGPMALTLAVSIALTTGQQIPKSALLEGHYQKQYGTVVFSPAFVSYFDSADHLQRVALHSGQTATVFATNGKNRVEKWVEQIGAQMKSNTVLYLDFSK